MVTKGRISGFSVILLMVIIILIMSARGTAVLAENRETKKQIEIVAEETNEYDQTNLERISQAYGVEVEYLQHIAETEKAFGLEPYELFALIAQESEFKPMTHQDGGSLSYSTTQMKMPTAQTAYMAITKYYHMDIPAPTHELLEGDEYYTATLAGGYLKYLHDVYKDPYESYTAYRYGICGRDEFYKQNGHYRSQYALDIEGLRESFVQGM